VLSPHPEETPGLKQVEIHALHWLYDHRFRPNAMPASVSNHKTTDKVAITRIAESQPGHPQNVASTHSIQQQPQQQVLPPPAQQSVNSNLSEQALKLAESIFDQTTVVRYAHREVPASQQVITESDGTVEARTDCSGFISYIVNSIGPRHYQVVRDREPDASYPQAKIWARFFDTLDSAQPHDGVLRISDWRQLRPGDFIAWAEGGESASGNTGHVMMVAGKPSAPQQANGARYIEVPVIDSSSVYHFPPEHLPAKAQQAHRDGLGEGCVRIILSEADAPIGYWAGTYWGEGDKPINGPTLSKVVRFARMMSLQE